MYQEYPKVLYVNNDVDKYVVVTSKEEEQKKRELGFSSMNELKEEKQDLKAQAKSLGIKGYHLMGEDKLKEAIKGK